MNTTIRHEYGAATPPALQAWRRLFTLAAGLAAIGHAAAQAPVLTVAQQASEIRLSGERITLPIVMVREYPFIEGSIAGVTGKLMFDTGAEHAFVINSHRVPVKNALAAGQGKFGSGQTYAVQRTPLIEDIQVGTLHFPRATEVNTQDATQLERITPDFIGWLGHYFWDDYAFKVDYDQSQVTFYRNPAEKASLAGEQLVAALPFDVRKRQNIPVMEARIGDMQVTAAFDTGQFGYLYVDAQTKQAMLKSGLLKPTGKDDIYELTRLTLSGKVLPPLEAVKVDTDPFPASVPTGLPDRNLLTIGYGFLRDHKTVWDYRKKTIYVLGKH